MAVKIRLRRLGRRKRPFFGLVATDSRNPRDGRYIEDLGRYDALAEPATVTLNEERVLYWLEQGAEPSDTVRSILSRQGIMLALHMRRKGRTDDEIQEAVRAHRDRHAEMMASSAKTTAGDRRAEAMEAERSRAAKAEAEAAKARAEAEAKARAEADKADAKAREEAKAARDAAATAARIEQESRNVAQAGEDAALARSEPEGEAAEPEREAAEPAADAPSKSPRTAKKQPTGADAAEENEEADSDAEKA